MNTLAKTRATAATLATIFTLTLLAGIQMLATSPAPEALVMAIEGPAAQTIVIESRRDRA